MYIRTTAGEIINTTFMQHIHITNHKVGVDEKGEWKEVFNVIAEMHMAPAVYIAADLPTKKAADDLVVSIWGGLKAGSNTFNVPSALPKESRFL